MYKERLIAWISCGIAIVGVVSSGSWYLVSQLESNQKTLETVQTISQEGPKPVIDMLERLVVKADDNEDLLQEIRLDIVRECN